MGHCYLRYGFFQPSIDDQPTSPRVRTPDVQKEKGEQVSVIETFHISRIKDEMFALHFRIRLFSKGVIGPCSFILAFH